MTQLKQRTESKWFEVDINSLPVILWHIIQLVHQTNMRKPRLSLVESYPRLTMSSGVGEFVQMLK